MPAIPVFHTSPGSHHCRRVTLLIEEAQFEVDSRIVDVRPPGMGGANEQAEFLGLNPNGKVPVLVHEGQAIVESSAIMIYLCDTYHLPAWLPTDPLARARVAGWQFWQGAHLSPACDGLMVENMVRPMLGKPADEARVAALNADFRRWGVVLELALAQGPWLCGDQITCADLSVATALMYAGA